MALTVCGACDKSYLETKENCPHCGKTLGEQIAYCEGQQSVRTEKVKEAERELMKAELRKEYLRGVSDGLRFPY